MLLLLFRHYTKAVQNRLTVNRAKASRYRDRADSYSFSLSALIAFETISIAWGIKPFSMVNTIAGLDCSAVDLIYVLPSLLGLEVSMMVLSREPCDSLCWCIGGR